MSAAALTLLAVGATFSPTEGVAVSCQENLRGKVGRARVEVVVGAGALHEGEAERGVAHLLEHLVFRPLGFDDSNGATSWDYTTYYREVSGGDLVGAAQALLTAILEPVLAEGELELERQVVLRELERRGMTAERPELDPLFAGTNLARAPGGSADSVRSLSADQIRSFHRRHYVRENVAVILAGAVDCAAAREALAPLLARFPPGPFTPAAGPTGREPGARALPGAPGAFASGFYWYRASQAEELMYRLVFQHLQQRALQDLRRDRGLTYSPALDFHRRGPGGQIQLEIQTSGASADVETWYADALQEILTSDRPADLLAAARAPLRTQLEADYTRAGLAALRGERPPEEALDAVDDVALRGALPDLLAEHRSFGVAIPEGNWASLVILGIFGLVVLGGLWLAYRAYAHG
ncbi:MAG: insulinase family protein [Myxococcales bacterium]|nr:insulinase family protein [Myxococcales bacterium]